jgi:hypothetical protein
MLNKWFLFIMIFQSSISYGQLDFPYQKPSDDILSLADAKPAPGIRLNSAATQAVLTYRDSYKSIQEMSAPELKLAGIRINPATNGPSRSTYITNLKVLDIVTNKETQVMGLPSTAFISNMAWSNDQTKMAFTQTNKDGIEIWVLDMKTAMAKKLMLIYPMSWCGQRMINLSYLPLYLRIVSS